MANDPNLASRLALLPFDGSIVDKKGAVWTAQGGSPAYVTGVYASTQALGGPPAASRVQAPSTTLANFTTANVAFEFWFKGTASAGKAPYCVFSSRNTPATRGVMLLIYADTNNAVGACGCVRLDAPGIGTPESTGHNLCDGAWHFVQVIRVGSNVTMRAGNVGDANTVVYGSSAVFIGSISNSGFVAPAIGQEPGLTTYSPLEGLQAFRITIGTPVATLPTAVPTTQWPDGAVAAPVGRSALYSQGTVIAKVPRVVVAGGQAGAYGQGSVVARVPGSAAPLGRSAAYGLGVVTADPGAAAATATASGVLASYGSGGASAVGAALAVTAGPQGMWDRGDASVSGDATASPNGTEVAAQAGNVVARVAVSASTLGVGAAYLLGLLEVSAGALVAPLGVFSQSELGQVEATGAESAQASLAGVAAEWIAGDVIAQAQGSASVAGRSAAWSAGDVTAGAPAVARAEGVASTWVVGPAEAHTVRSPSEWVFWNSVAESRVAIIAVDNRTLTVGAETRSMAINNENRLAVIAGESREYRLTP